MSDIAVVITGKYEVNSNDSKMINSIKSNVKFNGFTYFDINFNFRLSDYTENCTDYHDFVLGLTKYNIINAKLILSDFDSSTPQVQEYLGLALFNMSTYEVIRINTSRTDMDLAKVLNRSIWNYRLNSLDNKSEISTNSLSPDDNNFKSDDEINVIIDKLILVDKSCCGNSDDPKVMVSKKNKYSLFIYTALKNHPNYINVEYYE